MSKISNVITMMELLSNGRKYSIKELAERLEVSEALAAIDFLDLWPIIMDEDESAVERIDDTLLSNALKRDLALTYLCKNGVKVTPKINRQYKKFLNENNLNTFLSDLNVFYRKLQNYHWNIKGKDFFTIHAKLTSEFVVSCMGYKKATVLASDASVIYIDEDYQALDELVVVGYTTEKRQI